MKRLPWLDVTKGLAILWVVYFHLFKNFTGGYAPSPTEPGFIAKVAGDRGWDGVAASVATLVRLAWLGISQLGFHAVGLFLIVSGWALVQAAAYRADSGPVAWGAWYRARLLRLYPMYWVAHLVYLVSPFVARLEPVDGRIIWSLSGLRFVAIQSNLMYLNAAWWYFSMLIQLYLIFPLLYRAMRAWGTPWFLAAACGLGLGTRFLLLVVYPQDGLWTLGGLAICRLPEFALGMALGVWHRNAAERIERFLLGGGGLVAGLLLYPAALRLYQTSFSYVFVDVATGICCFLVVAGVAGMLTARPLMAKFIGLAGTFSYGIYLVHQPYMIWLGERIYGRPAWLCLLLAIPVVAAVSAWGMWLEKWTNSLMDRILRAKTATPRPDCS
jgi:peptidoglycan/LPS O-acetylase OafA/YrhL